jgi:hypothetical protein
VIKFYIINKSLELRVIRNANTTNAMLAISMSLRRLTHFYLVYPYSSLLWSNIIVVKNNSILLFTSPCLFLLQFFSLLVCMIWKLQRKLNTNIEVYNMNIFFYCANVCIYFSIFLCLQYASYLNILLSYINLLNNINEQNTKTCH